MKRITKRAIVQALTAIVNRYNDQRSYPIYLGEGPAGNIMYANWQEQETNSRVEAVSMRLDTPEDARSALSWNSAEEARTVVDDWQARTVRA